MDLARLREENFEQRLRDRAVKEMEEFGSITCQDQGLISREFGDRIAKLPIWFNFCAFLFSNDIVRSIDDDVSTLEVFGQEIVSKLAVFHYAGPRKAWDSETSRYAKYQKMWSYSWLH